MLHIVKLAVGCRTLDELAIRMRTHMVDGLGAVPTRMMPKKADEVLAGGSLYRVMDGMMLCRQEIVDLRAVTRGDGTSGTLILVRDGIVPITPRAMRPFQGWRYLKPEDAPPDLANASGGARGLETLPPRLRRELASLCLL